MRSCGRKLLVRVRAPRKVATPATRPPGPLSCAQGLVKSLKRREARREAKNRNRNACCPSLAGRMTTEEEAAPETKSARANHRADQSPVACAQLLSSTVVLHGDSVTRLVVLADLAPREQGRQGRAHVRGHVARCTPETPRGSTAVVHRTGGMRDSEPCPLVLCGTMDAARGRKCRRKVN